MQPLISPILFQNAARTAWNTKYTRQPSTIIFYGTRNQQSTRKGHKTEKQIYCCSLNQNNGATSLKVHVTFFTSNKNLTPAKYALLSCGFEGPCCQQDPPKRP
jgi:hypothetical protein